MRIPRAPRPKQDDRAAEVRRQLRVLRREGRSVVLHTRLGGSREMRVIGTPAHVGSKDVLIVLADGRALVVPFGRIVEVRAALTRATPRVQEEGLPDDYWA